MTTELKQVIKSARVLSPIERLQVLQVLSKFIQEFNSLDMQSQDFWQS